MNLTEIERVVIDTLTRVLEEQGRVVPTLDTETDLVECEPEIDALYLAVVAIELEELTGQDPFAEEVPEFRTVREFAELYA